MGTKQCDKLTSFHVVFMMGHRSQTRKLTLKWVVVETGLFLHEKIVAGLFFLPGGGQMRGPGLDAVTEPYLLPSTEKSDSRQYKKLINGQDENGSLMYIAFVYGT